MEVNSVVYYWKDCMLEEAQVFMKGGIDQVLLIEGDTWVLKDLDEVIPIKEMTDNLWKYVNF